MKKGKYEKEPRMFSRKRLVLLVSCILLITVISVGTTLAYYFNASTPVINTFQAGSVGAKVEETVNGNTKESIAVKNTGDSPVYVRVKLVGYWVDSTGAPAPKSSASLSFTLNSNWTEIGGYYYYKAPLAGGATTANLLGSTITMTTQDGCNQVIEVLADTVQATPAEAVEEVWGVAASAFIS